MKQRRRIDMRILLIDDETSIRDVLVEVLEDEGYSVVTAANGLEAINVLRRSSEPPCVILLDLMMPVMTGWEFRKQQQQDPALAAIPVILLSAIQNIKMEATALGAAGHIPKPINFARLLDTVERYCAAHP
jgi:CheY-like chemotaxis protein